MPDYRLSRRPGSPRWYIVWTDEGRRSRRYSTGTADRGAAELVLAAFRLEQRQRGRTGDTPTIAGILADYYDGHASGLASAAQADIAVRRLSAYFGASDAPAASPGALAGFVEGRRKSGASDSTISRELSVLRAAFRRAERLGSIDKAPMVPEMPKAPPRDRWLTRHEAARLLWAAHRAKRPAYLPLFLRLALYTGARPGAVLDLTWERIDMDNRLIDFALPGRVQGRKRRAVVPIAGALYTALLRARRHGDKGAVFRWGDRQVASIKTAMRHACRLAGLQGVTPGTLRHTAATWAAIEGIDLQTIGRLLGHSKPTTTMRYAKYHPDFLRDVTQAIARGARQSARQRKKGG